MSNLRTGNLITPVILAGGMGARLFPISSPDCPKQFIQDKNQASLYQKTLDRVQNRSLFFAPLIIANKKHTQLIKDQTHYNHTALYEPLARNTAAAVAIAALHLLEKGREMALVLPSDHIIKGAQDFHDAIQSAIHHINCHDEHVLFGIRPVSPSSAFGYIKTNNFGNVTHFHEKPSPEIAAELLQSSPHTYWNSGIFAINLPFLMNQLKTIAPEFLARCEIAYANPTSVNYKAIPALSFDKLYLEYSPSLFCIKASFDWMDIGMQPELLQVAS